MLQETRNRKWKLFYSPPFLPPTASQPCGVGLHNKVHLCACTRQITHPEQSRKECTICTMSPFRNGWPCNTFSSTEAFWNKLLKSRYLHQKCTLWTMKLYKFISIFQHRFSGNNKSEQKEIEALSGIVSLQNPALWSLGRLCFSPRFLPCHFMSNRWWPACRFSSSYS